MISSAKTNNCNVNEEMMNGIKGPWIKLTCDDENDYAVREFLDDFLETPLTLERVKPHLVLVARPSNPEANVIRKPYLNLDLTVCFKLKKGFETGIFGVRPEMATLFNESTETLFEAASSNTRGTFTIKGMTSILMGFPGIDAGEEADEEVFDENEMMFVVTTKDGLYGASALFYPEVFQTFCEKRRFPGVYIIPSSIHELILVPTFAFNPEELAGMVRQVNEIVVEDALCLEPVVYEYRQSTREVTIAARAKTSPVDIARQYISM